MKRLFYLLLLLAAVFAIGCSLQINNDRNNPANIDPALPSCDENYFSCQEYDFSCEQDNDCASAAKLGSCYYPCGLFPKDNCQSIPKCPIVNLKKSSSTLCEIGHPCVEVDKIICVDNRCTGQ